MKKIYTLIAGFILFGSIAKAQDTLLFEDFELTKFYAHLDSVIVLPTNTTDTMWYSADLDQNADASGGNRSLGWFSARPFSKVDQYQTGYTDGQGNPDTNSVIAASSWSGNGDNGTPEDNWLITTNIKLGAHDTLFWKSAPVQTPRYLDGYEVKLSTTDNNDLSFSHLLFTAAEMTGTPVDGDTVYSHYTFSPSDAFIHGKDSTYIDIASTGAKAAHAGRLRPFSVPLDDFANQNVFIGFHHNSHDDNLISLDDIMVRGTQSNPNAGIAEHKLDMNLSVFPNPANINDNAQLNFELSSEMQVTMSINDITGKLIYSESKGSLTQGRHFAMINTSALAKGFYTIALQTKNGMNTTKLIVQ